MPVQPPQAPSDRLRLAGAVEVATDPDEILSYRDVAKLLRVSRKTVERLVADDKLASFKLTDADHSRRLFRRADVQAFIDTRRAS